MPPTQLWIIEPGAVVIPVEPELLLLFFAVVLELMIRGTLAFNAYQVEAPGIIVVLLHLHGTMGGEQQVIKPGVLAALIGREDLYISILAGCVFQLQLLPAVTGFAGQQLVVAANIAARAVIGNKAEVADKEGLK